MRTREPRANEPGKSASRVVRAEIVVEGEREPVVLEERVPKGFPSKLLRYLAEYMERGFRAAYARQAGQQRFEDLPSLAEFAPSLSGRPVNAQVEQLARHAGKLREQGLTYGQIATRLCDKRGKPHHHCGKKCADRIRQAVKSYLQRQELERIARGEL